jgi:triosephosphate isomerase
LSDLRTPTIIINFKAYREVEGEQALEISRISDEVARESGVNLAVCPPIPYLAMIKREVSIPVLSQHVDPLDPGSRTGWITPSMIRSTGAVGTLINHSEHQMVEGDISKCVEMCRKNDLTSIVCVDTPETAGRLSSLSPDLIAIESPELIGGDISVTTARPEVVTEAIDVVHSVDDGIGVLCGAGVKTGEDVKMALDLGTKGVLLASGVVKARSVEDSLRDLIRLI